MRFSKFFLLLLVCLAITSFVTLVCKLHILSNNRNRPWKLRTKHLDTPMPFDTLPSTQTPPKFLIPVSKEDILAQIALVYYNKAKSTNTIKQGDIDRTPLPELYKTSKPTFHGKKIYIYPNSCTKPRAPNSLCLHRTDLVKYQRHLKCDEHGCKSHKLEWLNMYDGDLILPKVAEQSIHVTDDPRKADLFLINHQTLDLFHVCELKSLNRRRNYSGMFNNSGDCCLQHAQNYLLNIANDLTQQQWWQRHNGADHVMVWSQGAGECEYEECSSSSRSLLRVY